MQVAHQRDIDELEAQIKTLADFFLGEQSNT